MIVSPTIEEKDAPTESSEEITFEEFLTSYDGSWAEWVDGKVIEMSPPNVAHQNLAMFLSVLLRLFVEEQETGSVLAAPFLMRIPNIERGREPDLLFVAADHMDRFTPTHLAGPADLVVEIISPESVARDRGDKFVEYEAAGIPEYWLIDPERKQADFFVLVEDGHYRAAALDEQGRFHSHVLVGLWVKPTWFWQDPLPPVLGLLREIGVV